MLKDNGIQMERCIPKQNRIREGSRVADFFIYGFAALIAFISVYPMWYVLVLSLSAPEIAITRQVYWWPKGLYLEGYAKVLSDSTLWLSYRNTIFYAAVTCILMLVLCSMAAYTLSEKRLRHRTLLNVFLLIPMYFTGGIIPLFILVGRMGMYNTPWALILPGCVNIWYLILIKSYFGTIPESLREAARIDGADVYQTFIHVYIPASQAILAVVALYTIVTTWNSWFNAAVFISDARWQPLQIYLRRILVEQSVDLAMEYMTAAEYEVFQKERLATDQLKYTVIIVSTLPMLVAYPFFQQYFVKGVMLGSLKE